MSLSEYIRKVVEIIQNYQVCFSVLYEYIFFESNILNRNQNLYTNFSVSCIVFRVS